jgi:hypothetical protein
MNTMINRYLNLVGIEDFHRASRPAKARRARSTDAQGFVMRHLAFTPDHLEIAVLDPFAPMTFAVPAARNPRPKNEAEPESGNPVTRLIRLLAARFPVVRRLAGEESFLGAACGYVLTQPPRSASLLRYGEAFPTFLRSFGDCASIEYLADIAALEWARHTARYAVHAAIDRLHLSRRLSAQLSALRIALHPSVTLIASRFPIVTIWEANRSSGEAAIGCWNPEQALVARPFRFVEVRRLPPGGHAFLETLRAGGTIGDAAEAGGSAAPSFDFAANVRLLAESKIAVAVR